MFARGVCLLLPHRLCAAVSPSVAAALWWCLVLSPDSRWPCCTAASPPPAPAWSRSSPRLPAPSSPDPGTACRRRTKKTKTKEKNQLCWEFWLHTTHSTGGVKVNAGYLWDAALLCRGEYYVVQRALGYSLTFWKTHLTIIRGILLYRIRSLFICRLGGRCIIA